MTCLIIDRLDYGLKMVNNLNKISKIIGFKVNIAKTLKTISLFLGESIFINEIKVEETEALKYMDMKCASAETTISVWKFWVYTYITFQCDREEKLCFLTGTRTIIKR